jgi:hypothetical protein
MICTWLQGIRSGSSRRHHPQMNSPLRRCSGRSFNGTSCACLWTLLHAHTRCRPPPLIALLTGYSRRQRMSFRTYLYYTAITMNYAWSITLTISATYSHYRLRSNGLKYVTARNACCFSVLARGCRRTGLQHRAEAHLANVHSALWSARECVPAACQRSATRLHLRPDAKQNYV